ncbi:MAG: amidohydrolase family protein [Solirubrobacterales bacterium]|nr:amidohydrolase family protein [Solirubrobacterales bacterium]
MFERGARERERCVGARHEGGPVSPRVIDAHVHLYGADLAPPYWYEAMAEYGASLSGRPREEVLATIERDWFDPDGDRLVADMDAAGIDRSLVYLLDFGLYGGTNDSVSLERRYELFAAAVARHRERLVFFGGVDPRRPDALRLIERAHSEWGLAGVKIWPPAGVYPNEPACYRVYQLCAQLGLPVVIHTGQEIGPLRSECTRPIYADQPANDFPELTFVLAHAGMAWWREAADIAWHHPNVYVDIAYWQSKYLRSPEGFARELRGLISTAGKRRVIFGTDWPALRAVRRVAPATWVEVLRRLPEDPIGGVEFEREEIDLLLGGNAEAILGL